MPYRLYVGELYLLMRCTPLLTCVTHHHSFLASGCAPGISFSRCMQNALTNRSANACRCRFVFFSPHEKSLMRVRSTRTYHPTFLQIVGSDFSFTRWVANRLRKTMSPTTVKNVQERATGNVQRDQVEDRDRLANGYRCFASTNSSPQLHPNVDLFLACGCSPHSLSNPRALTWR